MIALDPRYMAARSVLLDALGALEGHGRAVIVVGAQAVYLRTGDLDLAVAPFTTNSDLALDPSQLRVSPLLEAAMGAADFVLTPQGGGVQPGAWQKPAMVEGLEISAPVDLIVPDGVAVAVGRRGARLEIHGSRAARRTKGLEAALLDHSPLVVKALDPSDSRSIRAEVAGPASLFVA